MSVEETESVIEKSSAVILPSKSLIACYFETTSRGETLHNPSYISG